MDAHCNPFNNEELPTLNAVILRLLDWTTTDPGTGKSAVAHSLIAHLKSQGPEANIQNSFETLQNSIHDIDALFRCPIIVYERSDDLGSSCTRMCHP
jgi:hypothetical protein